MEHRSGQYEDGKSSGKGLLVQRDTEHSDRREDDEWEKEARDGKGEEIDPKI